MLLALILALILKIHKISTNDLPDYNITNIVDRSGIFYHQLGQARLSNDQFTLLSFLNISIFEQKLHLIRQRYQNSIPLCQFYRRESNKTDKEFRSRCEGTLDLIEKNLVTLEDKYDSICHLTGHSKILLRQKRGLINGVSYALKWLFGTPDSDDAQFYSDAISSMAQQTDDMHKLMKQQVHILSDALRDYNETARALMRNQEIFNENFRKFNTFATTATKKINALTYKQTVIAQLNLLTILSNELNEEFDVIISAILFSKQNILHPSIITPTHLRQELLKIKLNPNLEFPFEIEKLENAYKYLEICSLSVIYSDKILIYAIRIPLVTKNAFSLYNLIPLPVKLTNSSVYSFINPSFPYLLLSHTKNSYGQMKDLANCMKVPPSDFICSKTTTYLIKERPLCEVRLKTEQMTSIPEDCDTKVTKGNFEIWHPISTNQWLFVVTNPTIGTIYCDSDSRTSDANINGVGIFTLKPKCKCYTLATTLIASSNLSANYTSPLQAVDITLDDCCQIKQDLLQADTMEPVRLENVNLNDLNHADSKLNQINDELQKRIDQPFLYHTSKWYNTLTGSIALTIFFLVTCFCCCRKCRWLPLRWIRNICSRDPCRYLLCINSHNTITDSRLSAPRVTFRRTPGRNETITTNSHLEDPNGFDNEVYLTSTNEPPSAHIYEEIQVPEPTSIRMTRSKTRTLKI